MAYTAATLLNLTGLAPGRNTYRYDTTDHADAVEAANYFNNVTNDLNLAKGDKIETYVWSATPFAAASLVSGYKDYVVTNVIARGEVSEGRVNIAEAGVSSSGALSSLT